MDVAAGDIVKRMIGDDQLMMELKVTEVTNDRIICGPWEFDKKTGAEIDDDLEWGPEYGATGTYLKK